MRCFFNIAFKRLAALLLAVLFIGGCGSESAQIVAVSGFTMGTTYNVKWVAKDASNKLEVKAAIDQKLLQVNQSMSTYIDESELSVFNKGNISQWYQVSDGLLAVLNLSNQISKSSAGRFDVTVGPLVNLWGFGPDGRIEHAPTAEEINELKPRIGFNKLEIDVVNKRIRRLSPIYVDLSAVAKGYGVDVVANTLEEYGVTSYLVEIGGELRIRGAKPNNTDWLIAVEVPDASERQIQSVIAPGDKGVATSGDYRNYFEENGMRFSHTIDPRTAQPITHKLASVTVVADTAAQADAYATALLVMGDADGLEFAQANGLDAYFIVKSVDGFETKSTPGFERFFKELGD